MIVSQLSQRGMARFSPQYVRQGVRFLKIGGETETINSAKRSNEGITMFSADFAILVAVAIIQARFFHGLLSYKYFLSSPILRLITHHYTSSQEADTSSLPGTGISIFDAVLKAAKHEFSFERNE